MSFVFGQVANLDAAKEAAYRAEIKKGGKVLIIGHTARTYFSDLANDPRVELWNDDTLSRRPTIPVSVRVVFMTAKLSHAVAGNIAQQCERNRIKLERFWGNVGQVRETVTQLLGGPPPPKPKEVDEVITTPIINQQAAAAASAPSNGGAHAPKAPEPKAAEPEPPRTPKGALRAFVLERVTAREIATVPLVEIAVRILPEAQRAFPATTRGSVEQILSLLKRSGALPHKPLPEATVRKVAPAPLVETSAVAVARDGDDDVARLLVDAIAAVNLALESYRAELAKSDERVRARVKEELSAALKGVLGQ